MKDILNEKLRSVEYIYTSVLSPTESLSSADHRRSAADGYPAAAVTPYRPSPPPLLLNSQFRGANHFGCPDGSFLPREYFQR
uniref:Uncharacterized protein n=1 Tax=Cucumis melo TaxID=3656 RepID=A0A9I9EJ61_CUCME